MKEIKFRLIKTGKIVGYERHTLKNQCGDDCRNVICIEHQRVNDKFWWCIRFDIGKFIFHDKKNSYTGLKAKNGEIYEGDIVKANYECAVKLHGVVGLIEWAELFCGWRIDWDNGGCRLDYELLTDLEIIGNIYENPQLLRETK